MSTVSINQSTLELIYAHLQTCSGDFIPELCVYVDILRYARKIYEKAYKIEIITDNVLTGLLAVYFNSEGKFAFISNLSVLRSFHGRGVSKKLIDICKVECKQREYIGIKLEVHINNSKAITFYKKHGFEISGTKNAFLIMEWKNMNRDYNRELKDTVDHKYAYNFDFDVMHHYMIESFRTYFKDGNCLELGSFRGDFTKRLLPFFENITCVEASEDAIEYAKIALNPSNEHIVFFNEIFENVKSPNQYDNIILTHVLEHLDEPVELLKRINHEWLSKTGRLFLVCPNANAASRQIAVKMGLISHNAAVTHAEDEHGHRVTYSFDTLERDVRKSGLKIIHHSGIFFKALANFQWDELLKTNIISKEYLDGCFELGKKYPDLCSSILFICEKG